MHPQLNRELAQARQQEFLRRAEASRVGAPRRRPRVWTRLRQRFGRAEVGDPPAWWFTEASDSLEGPPRVRRFARDAAESGEAQTRERT